GSPSAFAWQARAQSLHAARRPSCPCRAVYARRHRHNNRSFHVSLEGLVRVGFSKATQMAFTLHVCDCIPRVALHPKVKRPVVKSAQSERAISIFMISFVPP